MSAFILADLIEPNWHVAVVHFPIALLATGVVLEPFAKIVGAESLRMAARWMVLLGALLAVPVALSGLFAMNDIARAHTADATGTWQQVVTGSTLSAAQWEVLRRHVWLQAIATGVAVLAAVTFLGSSDNARRVLYAPVLGLLLGALGATLAGAHVGGNAVYVQGLGVMPAGQVPTSMPTGTEAELAYFLPPLEIHMLLAGLAVSFGLGALGCSFRNSAVLRTPAEPAGKPIHPGTGRASEPTRPVRFGKLPAAWLWILTSLTALAAGTAGTWNLAIDSETHAPGELWGYVMTFPPRDVLKAENRDALRRPVHVATGVLLSTVPLLLALNARWRARSRVLLTVFGTLFVLAAAGQVYVGTLLLYDAPMGPLTHFMDASH